VLSQEPYNYNTRAAGWNHEYALILVDEVLVQWADEIVVMDGQMQKYIAGMFSADPSACPPIKNLDIPDMYGYMDEALVNLIKERYV